jgi:hypothetical protein
MSEAPKPSGSRLATFVGVSLALFVLSVPAYFFGPLLGIHYTLEYFAWIAGGSAVVGLLVAIFKRD